MTSSSSPGISLMQETISYLASAELPAVIVNITRGSPGLGRITPAQSDYNQATKGGGHGDYNILVFAPSSVQEMMDLTILAFELGDYYRIPAMILGDGIVGQMMESVILPDPIKDLPPKPWAVGGCSGRERNLVISAPFTDEELIQLNQRLQEKYRLICKQEQRVELVCMDDAEYILVAFGIVSRLAHSAVESLREQGYRVGMIRPVTLWPFPEEVFQQYNSARGYLVVEMNEGQMLLDVKLALNGRAPVKHFGQGGGWVPSPQSIEAEMLAWIEEVHKS